MGNNCHAYSSDFDSKFKVGMYFEKIHKISTGTTH